MNMKRTIGICILVVFLILILILIANGVSNDVDIENSTENQIAPDTEETTPSSRMTSNYEFIMLEEDGRLTVYYADMSAVYLNTGISVHGLDKAVYEQLEHGIRFENEKELFDFLESYSS